MGLGFLLFAIGDTGSKYLTESLHPVQIAWARQSGLLLGALILLALKGWSILKTDHLGLQIARGFMAAISPVIFIFTLAYVPLADAMAITFVAPFFVTVMGAVFLREAVGIRRWASVAIGFVGILIVIRPGMGTMHPAVFLIVLVAGIFAGRQILSRMLSTTDNTITTIAFTALVSGVLLTLPLPFFWQWPKMGMELIVFCGMGLFVAVGEVFVIKALEITPAVVLAPVQYSILIWGTILGFLVFHQLPDFWTWVGVAIIMATGIYTLYREGRSNQAK